LYWAFTPEADYKIIVPIDPPAEGDGPIRLNRKVAVGDCFYAMVRKPVSGWQNVHQTMQSALAASHGTIREVGLFLGFGCTGLFTSRSQKGVAEQRWSNGFKRQPSQPLVAGGLCGGRVRSDPLYGSGPMNMSLWVRCWLDRYASARRTLSLAKCAKCGRRCVYQQLRVSGRRHGGGDQGGHLRRRRGRPDYAARLNILKLILGDGFGYASPRSTAGPQLARSREDDSFRRAPETVGGRFSGRSAGMVPWPWRISASLFAGKSRMRRIS